MSVLDRLRTTQITPRTAAYCIIALVVLLSIAVVTVRKMSDTSPVYAVAGKTASKSEGVDVKIDEKKGEKARAASRSADPYAVIVERNLFRPVTAASLASVAPNPPAPAPPTKAPLPPMPIAPQGNIDEVKKNVAFTGAVGMPSGQQALLENLQTKETKFVGQGESAFGYRVVTISSQLVVLEKNGLQFTLTMGENKPDAPAPAAGKPGGQPGQPGQPGGPGGPEGQPKPGG